ncbi:ribosome small subunit-dependent GTPase A [Ostreibacterium oceani]|uniref:Small ribosomal subunit biogenesis GTPase RsgA n=1 Tax=Ostreibacterium oceani TaxID=2654998 RepID=A0A6N7F4B8_9GAMM|nr:ribosome small subunit-dependent GTPase A [Ostreibacterium oceani]MPV86736.1 ribosome small subunit-dependent GTPase A [Ostreibacterium oceani]
MAKKPTTRQSKHTLSIKQQTTVSENRTKRIAELQQAGAIKATVISHMGFTVIVQTASDAPLLPCDWRQHIGAICAGDEVLITQIDGQTPVIEAILPRRTVIEKQNTYRGAKPFAANLDQLVVVITHTPMFQTSLLDRYLITANHIGVDCLIFFNKTDILTDSDHIEHVERIRQIYAAIPRVTWVKGHTQSSDGLAALHTHLAGKTSVFAGQSGVGKSSLINALIPDLAIQTMSISDASGLGRHSTTNTTLYRLNANTTILDTPGVRSFDTYHLDESIITKGFPDIAPFLGQCQFRDCSHQHETDCALKNAVQAHKVSELRYNSFLQILAEVKAHD